MNSTTFTAEKPADTRDVSPQPDTGSDETANEVAWVFHPDRAAWAMVGVLTADEAAAWTAEGMSAADVRPWRNSDTDSDPAKIAQTGKWFRARIDPRQAMQFTLWDIGPDEAAAWAATSSTTSWPDMKKIKEWRTAGFTPESFTAWSLMFDSEVAALWRDAGFSAKDAWAAHLETVLKGIVTPAEQIRWATARR